MTGAEFAMNSGWDVTGCCNKTIGVVTPVGLVALACLTPFSKLPICFAVGRKSSIPYRAAG